VTKLSQKDAHVHICQGYITDQWAVNQAPNGGYLMNMAINAAQLCIPSHHPHPISFTGNYYSRAVENSSAEFVVRITSTTKNTTCVHVALTQQDNTKNEYLGVFSNLDTMEGFNYDRHPPLDMPLPEDCVNTGDRIRTGFGNPWSLCNRTDMRIPPTDPAARSIYSGKLGEEARFCAWQRSEDHAIPTINNLAFFCDSLPPPTLNILGSGVWVPTLEYTVHFWAKPPTEPADKACWLRTRFTTTFAKNSLLFEDGEAWSYDGKQLLATSRQLARVLIPRKK